MKITTEGKNKVENNKKKVKTPQFNNCSNKNEFKFG